MGCTRPPPDTPGCHLAAREARHRSTAAQQVTKRLPVRRVVQACMARKRKTPGGSAAGGESAGNKRARILATQAVAATVAVGLVFLCLTGAIKGFAKHEPSSGVYSFAEGVLDQHWTKTKVSAGWPPRRGR